MAKKTQSKVKRDAKKVIEQRKLKAEAACKEGVPEERISPMTSEPIDDDDFTASLGKGVHVSAMKNEAKALNRSFLAIDSVLESIATMSNALAKRAAEVIEAPTTSAMEVAMLASAVGKAAQNTTAAMAMLMDMHRIHLRDPIKAAPAKTVTQAVASDTSGIALPQAQKARDFIAKLVKLPPPRPRVRAIDPIPKAPDAVQAQATHHPGTRGNNG